MRTDLPAQPDSTRARQHGTDHLHGAYIQAIEVELAALGVLVRSLRLRGMPVRRADLEVMTEHRAEPVLLQWDEINGWCVRIRDTAELAVFFGIAVVPPPIHLATWLYLTLQHLDVTPVRARTLTAEPDVDDQLRAYLR